MAYNETAISGPAGSGAYTGQDDSDLAQEQLGQAFSQAALPATSANVGNPPDQQAAVPADSSSSPVPAAQGQASLSDIAALLFSQGMAAAPSPAGPDPTEGGAGDAISGVSGEPAATASGQTGGAVTRSYNASGALASTTATAADGSRVETVNDTGGSQTWSSVQSSYDASGVLVGQHVQYRDKHVDDLVIDPASQKVLSSTSTQADGTRLDTTNDLGGSQPWSSTTLHKDAAGHVTQADVQERDGSATRTGYDAKGVADSVTTWNADGSSTVLETNTACQPYGWQAWSTTQGSYDAAGHLTDEVAHNLDASTTTSHYDVARKDALQFQTTRNADGSSMDMVENTSGSQTYSAYDIYKDAAGHIVSQNIFNRNGSLETTLYTAAGAVQSSTTTNADHTSSVVTENADGSVRIDDYTAAGQLADEAVAHADKSVTKTVYQTINGTAAASATYQFNADGSWVEDDLDDALAGSPLLVQQVHNADGTETDYVHAPQGGQSYSSYTVQKDKAGTVTEEDIQGTDGSYTQDLYAAGKLAKSTRDAKDGSYAITYLNIGTQPWAAQTYSYNAQGQYSSAVSYYAASAGKAAYWTQDTWTASSETWTGQSVHYDNGTEYDVVIGAASDSFSFYTVGKYAAGTVRQQTVVNADGSTVVLGSDSAGHIDSRTVLQANGGFDQEVVNAAGQTSAIVSHGADGSGIVQAFTTGGTPGAAQALSYQSLTNSAGVLTQALLVGSDGSREQESYGADGQVTASSVTRADGTLVSAATYGAQGVQTSATTLNLDGSHTVLGFDAAGHVQTVSFTHDDGSGASFVVEAGGATTAGQAVLNQVSVSLAEQILAQPADGKHTVSQKVTLPDGELYNVTMGAAGNIVAKHEHPGALESLVDEVAGPVLNALAFIPPLTPFVAPLAAAYDAAQAGEDFSQGNVLGGVLNLGSAVGVGAVGVAAIASGGGFGSGVAQNLVSLSGAGSANALKVVGLEVLEGTAFVGGASGLAQGASSGDPLAMAAGGLELASAGLSGLVTSGQLDPGLGADATGIAASAANKLLAGQVSLATGLGSVALGSADGLEHGDVLGSIGGLLAAAASSGQAVADDLFGTSVAPAQTGAGSQGAAGGPDVLPGAQSAAVQPVTQEDLPAPPAQPGGATTAATTAANASGTGAAGGGAATGGSGAAGTSGATPVGIGPLGTGAGYTPGGSQQSGGLPTNGVTVDASGMVHVDVAPVSTSYAPTTGAPAVEDNSGGTTVRLGPIGLSDGASGAPAAGTNDGSSLTLAGNNLPPIVTGGTPSSAPAAVAGRGVTMGHVTGLPFLDAVPGDDGLDGTGSGANATPPSGSSSAASPGPGAMDKMARGTAEIVVGGGSMAAGGVAIAAGVATAPTGVGLGVAAGGVGLVGAGGLVALQGNSLFQQGLNEALAPAPASSPGSSFVPPPVVVPPGSSLAGALVNTGNLAQMTGLGSGSGIDTSNPGFSPAPVLPPLPGFTPTSDAAVGVLGKPETLPADTAAGGASVVSTPISESTPGSNVLSGTPTDGLQGLNVVTATGMGSMELPRTEGLGASASMADLVAAGALPGRQGVILTDPASNPSAVFGEMYDLSQQTGAEYALTKENGQLVLYSGAPNSVSVPSTAEPIAHTHPEGTETLPSMQDIQVLNRIWMDNPTGPRPSSTVIWGSSPDNVTIYNATGFDNLTGPR